MHFSIWVQPNIVLLSGTPIPSGLGIAKTSNTAGMPQPATWRVAGNPTVAGTGTGVYEFSDPNAGTVTMILLAGETTRIPVAMDVGENTPQPLDVSIDRSPGAIYLIWLQ